MDHSLPGSPVHVILQARILEWIAIPFFRGSSQPKDWARVSCIVGWFFTIWATREALVIQSLFLIVHLLSVKIYARHELQNEKIKKNKEEEEYGLIPFVEEPSLVGKIPCR